MTTELPPRSLEIFAGGGGMALGLTQAGFEHVSLVELGAAKGVRSADACPDNLQTECARCNETVGDVPPDPETLAEVMAAVSKLGAKDKRTLLAWLESGYRHCNKVDMALRQSPSPVSIRTFTGHREAPQLDRRGLAQVSADA